MNLRRWLLHVTYYLLFGGGLPGEHRRLWVDMQEARCLLRAHQQKTAAAKRLFEEADAIMARVNALQDRHE